MLDNAEEPKPQRAQRWQTYAGKLLLELLVVFIGVYAASAVGNYQQQKRNEALRHQIRLALIREIDGVIGNTRNAARWVKQGLAQYEAGAARGTFVPPEPYLEPVRFQTHMWDATLQSGPFEIFDVPTVYRISQFYNGLNDGFAQLTQLRELSERLLLPVAGAPLTEYYDASARPGDDDRWYFVRDKYRWYFEGMRNLGEVAGQITEMGDSLIADLRRLAPPLSAGDTAAIVH